MKRDFAYVVMHSGASFFFTFIYNFDADFFLYLFSGILSANLMPMMRITVVLHVKGSAIVPNVVVNGVNHMLESEPATKLHHPNFPSVSSLAPKRIYLLH